VQQSDRRDVGHGLPDRDVRVVELSGFCGEEIHRAHDLSA
jgi:hypothetical protein